MNKRLILISLIMLMFCAYSALQAQTEASSGGGNPVNIFGKVSNINIVDKQITVLTPDGKSVVATFDKLIEFKRVPAGETTLRNASEITLSEISAGDNALVRGKSTSENNVLARQIIIVTQSDITRTQDQKREQWKQRGIAGIVKKVDFAARKISIQTKGANSQSIDIVPTGSTIFQRYETDAGSLNDFKPSNLEAIKEGDQIRTLGTKSADGLQFIPEEVFSGSFRVITGKVSSINPEGGELKLTDLQNGKTVTVVVNSDSNLRHLTQDAVKNAGENASITKGASTNINLTALLEKSPKINIADIKTGETLVIASLSETGAERIVGLTVVSGIELLNIQTGNKSGSNTNKKFNLDVF